MLRRYLLVRDGSRPKARISGAIFMKLGRAPTTQTMWNGSVEVIVGV
jgi:hypothetical protein